MVNSRQVTRSTHPAGRAGAVQVRACSPALHALREGRQRTRDRWGRKPSVFLAGRPTHMDHASWHRERASDASGRMLLSVTQCEYGGVALRASEAARSSMHGGSLCPEGPLSRADQPLMATVGDLRPWAMHPLRRSGLA
jgi:hypothetical protein